MKHFKVAVSDGTTYQFEAAGHADAASKLICEPTKYPLPVEAVVGIEGPTGHPRFYKKRSDGHNLWPISVKTAAMEAWMLRGASQ